MEEAAEEAGRKPQGLRDLQVGGQGPTSISLGEGRDKEEVFDRRGGRKVAGMLGCRPLAKHSSWRRGGQPHVTRNNAR